ncbi:hypothetical protein BCR35DRAFT_334600 [Leucosporidium creatinivorum]|uniref:Uncharacterized protein n=1 Tax=Leucosporidium creatinivorum TaxID=106004 RepID=A0A1Y2E261_9BASI|nr:hypothetical protein BCR35DRAFT_334600 [Leucosporidium creatinivorum]
MHPTTLVPGFPLADGSLARFDAQVSKKDSKGSWVNKVKTGSGSWCAEWRKSYTLIELTGVQIEIAHWSEGDKTVFTAYMLDEVDRERIEELQRQISSRKGSFGFGGAPLSSESFKLTYSGAALNLATFTVDGETYRMRQLFETVKGKRADLAKKLDLDLNSPVSTIMATKARGFLVGALLYLVHLLELVPIERPWNDLDLSENSTTASD